MKQPMTESEVRSAWAETQHENLNAWRREMRAKGLPLDLIEQLTELSAAQSAANLERDLPLILRDLAISAGDAMSH